MRVSKSGEEGSLFKEAKEDAVDDEAILEDYQVHYDMDCVEK
jgi:hypothetical protein